VLCLHDELLVHCRREHAAEVARIVEDSLAEAAGRWAPGSGIRFISDTTIVRSWAQAKGPKTALPPP
jgi:DNA polymerase-1